MFEVEGQAPLVSIVSHEVRTVEPPAPSTERITALRILNLNDLCA
jgi:hypothetical protein